MKIQNPNTTQRDKILRFQKGLLMMQNRAALQKYAVMSQAESRMTLGKSIAIWKHNSGVASIEQLMDYQYRSQSLNKLVSILDCQIKC